MKLNRIWWIALFVIVASANAISLSPRTIVAAPVSKDVQKDPTALELKKYVHDEAISMGVNPVKADWIFRHESQYCGLLRDGKFEPGIKGDDGKSVGCWQIYLAMHPDVSLHCAANFPCSTRWALTQIKAGHIDWWTTWKYRFEWYPNQNPPI